MNKQEKTLRDDLTDEEMALLEKGFGICDVVWKRINQYSISAREPFDIKTYYYSLSAFLKILNSNKDYKRAAMLAIQMLIIDSSGIDLYRLNNNELKYHTPKRTIVVNTGMQYLLKKIKSNKLDAKSVKSLFDESDTFLGKNIVPFNYLSKKQLYEMFQIFTQRFENKENCVLTISDYFPDADFSNKVNYLKEKGLINEYEIQIPIAEALKKLGLD